MSVPNNGAAPAAADETPNYVTPIGYRSHNDCGYCKGERPGGSRSYYLSGPSLTPAFYQSLICRGFRRSGSLVYKPDLANSCCAQYTIRLPASQIHVSKDQRQAINRFNRYMLGDAYIKARERVKPKSKEERKRYEQTFDLSERVHEAEAEKNPPLKVGKGKEEQEIRPEHAFEVSIEAANFTKEKYELYAQYQKTVHNDTDCSEKGFKRFLCELPMKNSKVSYQTPEGETKEKLLGSYHQLYRLDGKLVAIAVLDLLPDAVSAVYFIYDESLHKWSPGKLSALREASLAVEAGYEWYMMGYYIHSCKKMRYKGDYGPQEILDPASLGWWPLDEEIKRKLDERKYVSVSEDRKAEQEGKEPPQPEPTPYDEDDPTPVWDRGMPGVLSKAEVEAYDLGAIALNVGGQDVECQDLVVWASSNLDRNDSIRCWIGELVAAVGTELADQMTVKFS